MNQEQAKKVEAVLDTGRLYAIVGRRLEHRGTDREHQVYPIAALFVETERCHCGYVSEAQARSDMARIRHKFPNVCPTMILPVTWQDLEAQARFTGFKWAIVHASGYAEVM